MHLIAGRFKRFKIETSVNLQYRPTKSIVRKSIFDFLSPFKFKNTLDLFSGSGIFGFEAASRGASSITFVENNKNIFRYLKKNADRLKGPDYNFFRLDVFKYLKKSNSFDLIFADPPYSKYDLLELTEVVLQLLNTNGKFLLECEKKQPPFLGANVKDYGRTRILYWENT